MKNQNDCYTTGPPRFYAFICDLLDYERVGGKSSPMKATTISARWKSVSVPEFSIGGCEEKLQRSYLSDRKWKSKWSNSAVSSLGRLDTSNLTYKTVNKQSHHFSRAIEHWTSLLWLHWTDDYGIRTTDSDQTSAYDGTKGLQLITAVKNTA